VRVVLLASVPNHAAGGTSPSYAAALGPRTTAGNGWSACGRRGHRRHASRTSSSGGDENISTRIVKLATVEFPPPHECVDSRLKVGRQRERATAHCLVHTAAHSLPVNKAIGESLFKLWVPLHPVCLGYHLTEVVTQVRAIADEKLHTTLHTDISMVLGRPLQHKLLSSPDRGHGIQLAVPLIHLVAAAFFVGVAEQPLWYICTRPDVTTNIGSERI